MKIDAYSPTIRRKEMDAVLTTMVGEKVGPGEQGARLAAIAKEYLAFEHCLALRGPATALWVALRALDLPEGSAVLASPLSPAYYADVVAAMRLRLVCCDVDEASGAITEASARAALGPDVKALVSHHALGIVPDSPSMAELGIPLIEDCSRSYGANWGDRKAGSWGALTLLGLEERDLLTAGGGALLYANGKREASVLRQFSELPPEFRLPDLNAALAFVQFKEAERNFEKRKEIAAIYLQSALRTKHRRLVQGGDCEYNNYAFPLVLDSGAKDAKTYAGRKDVSVAFAFEDTLVSKYPDFAKSCPVAYSLLLRTIVFPLYPRLGSAQVSRISKVLATLP